jgi:hypothetical protein
MRDLGPEYGIFRLEYWPNKENPSDIIHCVRFLKTRGSEYNGFCSLRFDNLETQSSQEDDVGVIVSNTSQAELFDRSRNASGSTTANSEQAPKFHLWHRQP